MQRDETWRLHEAATWLLRVLEAEREWAIATVRADEEPEYGESADKAEYAYQRFQQALRDARRWADESTLADYLERLSAEEGDGRADTEV